MSSRWLMTLLCVALLGLGTTGDALAQKTKTKGGTAPQAQTSTQTSAVTDLDPSDPEELEEILDEADAAYFGDSPDYEYAYKMYLLAAEAGSPYAMNRVGLMHDKGQYVAQSYTESFRWFMKAAEGGLPVGMSNVADMYYYGDGVEKDFAEARRWYTRAADADYGYAMTALGNLYLAGEGVTEDHEEAVYWFRQASDAGDPGGHWSLALRLLYGDGIDRDTSRAAELAYLALVNGHETALKEFKIIKDADTPPSFRRKVQELLKRDGFYSGGIDGDFGPSTLRAVEAAYESAL
jgi:FOG: TPR repeat, SEL1 subfamily